MQINVKDLEYKIITSDDDPTNRLKQKCSEIAPGEQADYTKLLRGLYDWCASTRGKTISACGIALPQIGICKRGFVTNGKYQGKKYGGVFINPKIIEHSESKNIAVEGCLSEPGLNINVVRYDSIRLEYYDGYGEKRKKMFIGYIARVIQHELDHLDGILLSSKPFIE